MGCVTSKQEHLNHPRIFHVWNVDGDGRHLKPGRIEVTDSQLILHQKGNIVVKWPLKSLRRYGFDSEVFSFECGRRCSTGPGVYAFKCRRAQALFTILQECINNSGTEEQQQQMAVHASPPLLPNLNLQNSVAAEGGSCPTVDSSGYLEPITANSHLHYPRAASAEMTTGSPGGYVCIHSSGNNGDWPNVASSLPNCCGLGSSTAASPSAHLHHYTNAEIIEQASGGGCPNSRVCLVHHYVNSSVVTSSDAVTSHRCCSNNMPPKCCSEPNGNTTTYVNGPMVTLSPGHLACANCADANTNYAKLDDLLKQEQSVKKQQKDQPFYVNVKPDAQSASSKCVSGHSTPTGSGTLTSPTKVLASHCYANLSVEAESSTEDQVNYAVLDLDQNEPVMSPVSVLSREHSVVSSPVRSPEGYAQIDFDKTVALSNSANPCPLNDDSIRKTRHNAVIPCPSMSA